MLRTLQVTHVQNTSGYTCSEHFRVHMFRTLHVIHVEVNPGYAC